MTATFRTPIVGGVMDGATHTLPAGTPDGYAVELRNNQTGQASTYLLHPDHVLVSEGMKWPIL